MASGTWTVVSFSSFTPATGGGDDDRRGSGGVLVLQVQLATQGGGTSTATMRIASTGNDSGVTLAIDGGATFLPSGIGRVRITTSSGGGEGSGGGGDDGGGDD